MTGKVVLAAIAPAKWAAAPAPQMSAAILAIWNDIAPESYEHFERWYTREHLEERVGVPGLFGTGEGELSRPSSVAPSLRP